MFAASKTDSASTGGYQISRSLRFNSADTTNLNRTFASAGNRRTFTLSFWLKRSRVGVDYEGFFASGNGTDQIRFENIDQLRFSLNSTASGDFVTTQVFRDVSAWYHIVFAVDTTQATSTNRVKIYVNGSQITSFTTASYPTLNYDCNFNSNVSHRLGIANDTSYPFNGYMTEVNFIDGQALTPSSFGETNAQTGVWQPKAYSGSYGTNGFYLNFSDNSNTTAATLGKDYSGNGNNWTPNNFSVTAGIGNDSLVDVPTLYGVDTGVGGTVRGNYATWNPLDTGSSSFMTTFNGNLAAILSVGGWIGIRATIGVSSDKWYWEVTCTNNHMIVGIMKASASLTSGTGYPGGDANGWGYAQDNGYKYNGGSSTAYGATYAVNDVIGIAFDADAGTLTFYKNGTSQGTAFTGLTSGPYFPAVGLDVSTAYINTGQRPFAYTAPSGYKALCTQNLPTPTIGATSTTLAGKYFNPVLYTGNGSTQAITGVGFQPDWVWIKERSSTGYNVEYDAVRGVEKYLFTNTTGAEGGAGSGTGVTAFGSDGFTAVQGGSVEVNRNAITYVAWNWKANGSGSTNTAGSITSTVSANTTSGFSIVTYTGNSAADQTVGHGLGVAPSMIIVKSRGGTDPWVTYHSVLGPTKFLYLNQTTGESTVAGYWGTPSSTTFGIKGGGWANNPSTTVVAYCFAEVAGYSKFGSYTGNGSTDGPFLYLGFTPKYILIKKTSSSGTDWRIITINTSYLSANTSAAEYDSPPGPIRGMSNGVKVVGTGGDINENGGTFIYAAFASYPFKYALAQSA